MRRKVAFFLLMLLGCSHQAPPLEKPSFPVHVTEVTQKPIDLYIEALGHVASITAIDIRSRIEGELTGVYFEQGAEVKKGDLLFTIDPLPYEAILKESQGKLNETIANLVLAEEKVKRYRQLARDEYYSQIDYETLQSNFAALAAQKEQYEASVERAKVDLNYCWIYAPIDGKTGILQIDFGNLVGNNGDLPLITLNQMDPIFVTFSIPEFQLSKVLKAQKTNDLKVRAAFEFFEGETFLGTLTLIDNAVDPATGMVKLRATFPNEERMLWPGQFIRIRLILTTLPEALLVPNSAIQFTPSGPMIFVLKEDMTVEQRKVVLGQREESNVVVMEGLHANEKVVIEGQLNLLNGTKVFISGGS